MHEPSGPTGDAETIIVDGSTELRNAATVDIDVVPTLEILELLNDEDARVPGAVRAVLPQLAELVDAAVRSYRAGGTIHYVGAGTSGRIAVLDAAELPPTFSTDPDRVVAHHAGGSLSFIAAVEGLEDDRALGEADADAVRAGDVVIGLAASGRTPYVIGALTVAAARGATTALVCSSVTATPPEGLELLLAVNTGPEAIAGSTRLKAGTAQKLVLNAFSTALMVRLGKTYSNLMVDVAPSNAKLRGRVLSILMEATGRSRDDCAERLRDADGDTKAALVSLLTDADVGEARRSLAAADGSVRGALGRLGT
ncbi:N-acetylmuramic acid 6-phosphate etherase [Nitriliruptor alkaliphilus]|uniref:N-acetylmuramic acid 6-phosphate etherase n=1 Tax=Nitriliruptor alkaliphilus TaxID=427918 RepID=UPI0006978E00